MTVPTQRRRASSDDLRVFSALIDEAARRLKVAHDAYAAGYPVDTDLAATNIAVWLDERMSALLGPDAPALDWTEHWQAIGQQIIDRAGVR
jgi:hypothetical protein